ncbi:MAG: class I SAM-dependent methyltransferase [Acidobacteria bacterium]|nr:class I SAM-dependent methyltransferase [Acidobacteriota bacterium]
MTHSAHPASAACGFEIQTESGIWKTIPASSQKRFEQFVREYEFVRAQEGYAATGGDYFLALPYKDLTGRNKWQWKIRKGSFRFLAEKVFPVLEHTYTDGIDILDIGSGNCWLSYRLALRGHRPVAVDLLLNHQDGLGAAHHYLRHLPRPFPRFQAEMNKLPFEDSQFDVAIFNASFHYSEGYLQTLRETLRCLRRPGHVMIVDSPHYEHDESGRRMVEEKHARFLEMYGFGSDSIASREYLTAQTLEGLSRETGVKWQRFEPWHGIRWALRPWKARLLGRREPAKFFLYWGSVGMS